MSRLIDETGAVYGRLTVIKQSGKDNHGHPLWECMCDCGNTCYVTGARLRNGNTRSCGCLHSEQIASRNTRHGKSKSRLYAIYKGMKDRCTRKANKSFPLYGERGIRLCDEWTGPEGYKRFEQWALENGYREDLTIDRIDTNGDYSPDNCRWANIEQQANNRRNNHRITFDGKTRTIAEWSRITGISAKKIEARLRALSWPVEKALTVQ